jgi:hypothetical protein
MNRFASTYGVDRYTLTKVERQVQKKVIQAFSPTFKEAYKISSIQSEKSKQTSDIASLIRQGKIYYSFQKGGFIIHDKSDYVREALYALQPNQINMETAFFRIVYLPYLLF